jgi:superfamily I DNA and/or RNA helicase
MKLPEQLKLIQEYLKEKKGSKNSLKKCKCIVTGLEKNIFILSSTDNLSFNDIGFSKNDAVDVEIAGKKYPGVIKELYSKYCYIALPVKNIKIKINDIISITDSIDTSFLYQNTLKAYLKIFKKSQFKKLKEFFIKVYSEEKLESPIKLKSFKIKPPSRRKPVSFFNINLDDAQKELVSACLNIISDENSLFYLGFGPPGCGKTATITEIALHFLKQNKKLLITSFTNVAVDNVIERLIDLESKIPDIKEKIIRVGSQRNIRIPKVTEVSLQKKLFNSTLDRDELIDSSIIVGATLDMLGTSIFENIQEFDLMIVDEASMVETTKLMMGLFRCKKFVLIGDPCQLRPFLDLKNRQHPKYEGYKKLIENPFFNLLMNNLVNSNNKDFHTQLIYHYRSPEEIIRFSNDKFYQNKLVCKTSEKSIKKFDDIFKDYKNKERCSFIKKIFEPNNKVVLVDTTHIHKFTCDYLNFCESIGKIGSRSYCNTANAALDLIILFHFLNAFYRNSDFKKDYRYRIGIISPFNYQVDLIEKFIFEHPEFDPYYKEHFLDNDPVSLLFRFIETFNLKDDIEIGTVNKYQGREKDIIIYDFTYWLKDHTKQYHPALKDINKLNVALTRAKSKLIIVGSFYRTGINIINDLHDKKYVTFNPAWYSQVQIDILLESIKKDYFDIYTKLKVIQNRIINKKSINHNEDILKKFEKIYLSEKIVKELVDSTKRKNPDFDDIIIYKKIKEKIDILTEYYYNSYPQKIDTISEKKRFSHYLDFEIKEDIAIEKEIISKFGILEYIEDINVLKNILNYLENKKEQFDKDSYLYRGLEHYVKIVNTLINVNKHKSRVIFSFKKFSKRKKTSLK